MPKHKMKFIVVLFVAVLFGATGCANQTTTNITPVTPDTVKVTNSTTTTINIENFQFNPATVTISAGQSVTWVNKDNIPHSVVGQTFSSPNLINGETFSFTFSTAGEYDYHCGIHASMTGKIIVK